MARTLGSAWVNISPSGFNDFYKKAQLGVKKALKGVDASVPVTADTKPAGLSIDALKVRLADLSRTVAEARVGVDDKEANAKLAAMDVKLTKLSSKLASPRVTLEGAAAVEAQLLALDASFDRLQHKADNDLAPSISALGETFGHASTGFLGLAAAGVVLSPVLVTTGIGMGGLGAAATKTIGPILKAGTATKEQQKALESLDPAQLAAYNSLNKLKGAFGDFAKGLEPQTIGIFTDGLGLAKDLLSDVQPVAKAAGNALDGVVQDLQADLKTRQWQSFFAWMAATAGPDIRAVGDAFISLLNTLPQLLTQLQPVALEMLQLVTDAGKLISITDQLATRTDHLAQSANNSGGWLGKLAGAAKDAFQQMFPGVKAAGALKDALDGQVKSSDKAGGSARKLATAVDRQKAALAAATPSATDLAHDIAILSGYTATAAQKADALNAAWMILVGNFASRETAILNAQGAVQGFADAIKNSGAGSLVAKQAFEGAVTAIGQIIAADQAAHVPAQTMYQDILAQYNALKTKGPLNKSERDQLDRIRQVLDIAASSTEGWTGKTKDAAKALENNFLPQLKQMHVDTPKVRDDVDHFTNSIINTGTKSTATHDARQKLINDLIAGGVSAKDAKRYVDSLQKSIDALHGKQVTVHVNGQGQWTLTGPAIKASHGGGSGNLAGGLARGGLIRYGSGPIADDVPAMLSRGEVVVPANMVQQGAVDHLRGALPGFNRGGQVPGYASGGVVSRSTKNLTPKFIGDTYDTFQSSMTSSVIRTVSAAIAATEAAARARAAALNPFAGISGVPSGGHIGAGAAAAQAFAKSILWAYGWGQNQFPPLQALWMGESGWNYRAYNASSGATGIPQSLPGSKMASAGADWRTNPATQIRWGLGYIKSVYGSPANAYGRWLNRSPHWYGEGGLVDGYAAGGPVTAAERAGQTWLNAWRSRRGGGYGAAWGPVVLNQQIPNMQAAVGRATTLSHASGLSSGQHRFWANAAADEKRRLAVLNKELTTERTWRGQLGSLDARLAHQVGAAGNLKSLAPNVRTWKRDIAANQYTVSQISKMLGYSDSYVAAHPKLPGVTHTYGGDVGDVIAEFLASALSPVGMAGGGRVRSYDSGGFLPPGLSMAYNGTGSPERVGGPTEISVRVELGDSFRRVGLTPEQANDIRAYVQVQGGGDSQTAFGSRDIRFLRRS